MKFYLYISDAKIDMLLPQIPHEAKKKVAIEFGIDLKVLTAKRTSEQESEQDRYSRLETVVSYIREFGNVGTVDDPDEYIDDTMPMRWGPMAGGPYGVSEDASMVYFAGATGKTVVGIGGSVHHVIGSVGTSRSQPLSTTPYLLMYLQEQISERVSSGQERGGPGDAPEREANPRWQPDPQDGLWAVYLTSTQMQGPQQQLEFLAKRLICGPNPYPERGLKPDMQVLLASPLYVALAE